jgi:hypothetical protein
MPELSKRNDRHHVARTQRLRRAEQQANIPCYLCGQPFDWQGEAARGHRGPWSWTADHVLPIAQALSMGMTQPQALRGEIRGAHRACNTRKGDGQVKATGATVKGTTLPDYLSRRCPVHEAVGVACTIGPHSRAW